MTDRDYALLRLWLSIGFVGCVVLLYACLIPHPPHVNVTAFDKLEHFTAYLVLGAWFGGLLAPRYLAVFVGLVVFGAAIEVLQDVVGRDAELLDWAADALGVLAGLGLARIGAMRWLRYIDGRVAAIRNSSG